MTWSSFEKDKLLTESWREFLQEEEQKVYGINSEINSESLNSLLKNSELLSDEQRKQLVQLMLKQAAEDRVVLEAIGDPQRDARTFSSDTVAKLNALIDGFGLEDDKKSQLENVLNRWAKLNTVKFGTQASAATAARPASIVSGEPAATASPSAPTPTPDAGEPSRIDAIRPPRSIRDTKGSEKYKKFMTNLLNFFANEMKMDTKIAKKIVHDIWKQTPPGNFNKLIFLEAIDKEIDIASILAKSGLPPVQQVKVLGALKKWAAQNSDLVDDRMTKILRLRDKEVEAPAEEPDAPAAEEPPSSPAAEEPLPPEEPPAPRAKKNSSQIVMDSIRSAYIGDSFEKDFNQFVRAVAALKAGQSLVSLEETSMAWLSKGEHGITGRSLQKIQDSELEGAKRILLAIKKARLRGDELSSFKASFVEMIKTTKAAEKAEKATPKVKPTSNKKTKAAAKEPEPEVAKPEQTSDPSFTRRAVRRIKANFNKLKIEDRLNFNKLKEAIEKILEVESVKKQTFGKNSLFVITLTNGEQFGLPKELQRDKLEFAFKESEEASNPKASALDKVIKLAKIKDGKIEEKGIVKYGTALKESLILTWKQIAGIK